jgi:hypothetical protein
VTDTRRDPRVDAALRLAAARASVAIAARMLALQIR